MIGTTNYSWCNSKIPNKARSYSGYKRSSSGSKDDNIAPSVPQTPAEETPVQEEPKDIATNFLNNASKGGKFTYGQMINSRSDSEAARVLESARKNRAVDDTEYAVLKKIFGY